MASPLEPGPEGNAAEPRPTKQLVRVLSARLETAERRAEQHAQDLRTSEDRRAALTAELEGLDPEAVALSNCAKALVALKQTADGRRPMVEFRFSHQQSVKRVLLALADRFGVPLIERPLDAVQVERSAVREAVASELEELARHHRFG